MELGYIILKTFIGYGGEIINHQCYVKDFFEENIQNYYMKESHKGKSLYQHTQEVVKWFDRFAEFYQITDPYLIEFGHYLAYYHDLGKLDRRWSIQNEKNIPHSPLSVCMLLKNKVAFPIDKKLSLLLLFLVGKHHSSITKKWNLNFISNDIKSSTIPLEEIIQNNRFIETLGDRNKRIDLIDVFGMFKVADVISASSKPEKSQFYHVVKNPQINKNEIKNIIPKDKFDNQRWKEQLKIVSLPSVGMLRAPTGWGKTSISLLFTVNKLNSRIFYLLPTTTAIKKFYSTLSKQLKDVCEYFYFYDVELYEHNKNVFTDHINELFFAKTFHFPIVITTVDQFLLSLLQVGKYHTKRFAFRNSAIILDEVHLLSSMMLKLLTFFLQKFISKYKLKLLLMSATFPKAYIEYFADTLNLTSKALLDYSSIYSELKRVSFVLKDMDILMDIDSIYDAFSNHDKRILVMVNTVEKAISIGKKIKDMCKDDEKDKVIVFHARLMYTHRRKREDKIDEWKSTPHILVATQVCEVSIDVSYDILYTELAPLASIIQRFGRVNRYMKGKNIKEINAYIYIPKEVSLNNEKYPYEFEEIMLSREVLESIKDNFDNEKQLLDMYDSIFTYEDLQNLIDKTTKKININAWEDYLSYIFSFDIRGEEIRNFLEYRDTFTTLAIPHPEVITKDDKEGIQLRRRIYQLIEDEKNLKRENFNEKIKFYIKTKSLSIQVPIWWIKEYMDTTLGGFPMILPENKLYSSIYGFIDNKETPYII